LLVYKILPFRIHFQSAWIVFLCTFILTIGKSYAQPCSGSTPSFTINLTGNPDSIWSSPSISRDGQCCGVTNPDQCIEFWVTLDPDAEGIKLSLVSGGLPPGALFYKIGCGPDISIDSTLCLSGVGPHRITFCKPGNNPNIYQITSIAKPKISDNIIVSEACVGTLNAQGLLESSITWTPIPNTPEYMSYLSCTSNCDTVIVTPSGNYPSFLDIQVCGTVIGGCSQVFFCDTARVTFVSNLDVDIQPKNATVCFGGLNASITANPVGGLAPYHYSWSTGATTQSISVTAGTYFVSMTDSLGCTVAKDTVTVSSFSMPIAADAGNDTLVCTKSNQVSLRGSVQAASGGQWKGGTGTFSPSDTVLYTTYFPSAAETLAGTVTLRLVTTGNGTCPADSDEVEIIIAPTPVPVITGNDTVCAFRNEVYSTANLANHSYGWNVTGGTLVSANNLSSATVLWGAAGTGNISVTVTNLQGCDSTQIMTTKIIGTPQPTITGDDSVCVGDISIYGTDTIAGLTYQWQVTNGSITGATDQQAVSIQWPANSTTGIISLTVTNTSGCDTTFSKTLPVNNKPAPIITGADSVCAFKSTNYFTANTAGNTYQWIVSGGAVTAGSNTNAVSILWSSAGAGNISLTVTNDKGCDSTVSLPVLIHPTPLPVITGADSVCAFKSFNYSTANFAGYVYQWNISGGAITSGNNTNVVSILWGAAGVGNISLTVTNDKGCDSAVNMSLIIHPTPAPTITGSDSVCAFKPFNYSTSNIAGNTYQWNVTGGTITAGNNTNAVTVLWGPSGAADIQLTVTNNKGCDSAINLPVIIHLTPAPIITGSDSVCAFKSFSYSTPNIVGNTYQWNVTGGTITVGNNTNAVTVLWGIAGAANIQLTVTNNKGCDSIVNLQVIIHPTPAPIITGSDSVCAFKPFNYSTSNIVGNTYQWNVSGGTIIAGNNTNAITILWGSAGAENISLAVSNIKGCDSIVNLPVTIHPTPAPIITGSDSVCAFKSFNYSTPNIVGNTYQWNVTGGTITVGNNTNAVTVLWSIAGAANIQLTVTNNKGCDSTINLPVMIHPTPAPIITGSDSICAFRFYNYSTAIIAGNTYQWNISGGTITAGNNTSNVTILWNTAGSGNIELVVTNNKGCDSVVNLPVIIHPTPTPGIIGSDSVCSFRSSNYSTAALAGNTYQWNISGGSITAGNNTNAVTILWGVAGPGNITLTVTNNKGCDSTVNLPVIIHPTPAPIISGSDSVCAFKSFNYSTAPIAGNTYQWNITGGTITAGNNTDNVTILWGVAGPGNITLTVTNNKGCDSMVSLQVIIHPTPAPTISGSDSVCAFKPFNYSTTAIVGNSYQWNVSGGTITAGNNTNTITILWGAAGTGNIALTVTNNKGCNSIVSLPLIIHSTPAPIIAGSDSVCAFKSFNYSTTNIAGNIYQWNVSGGTITAGSNTNTITILWGIAGAGNITLTVANNKGCDSVVNLPVIIHPTPAPILTGSDSVCAFKTFNYSTAAIIGNTYQWNITGGTITAGNTTNAITVLWGNAGAGNIALAVTNSKGCDSVVGLPITIHPTPAPIITGSDSTCAFRSFNYSTTNAAGNTYQWNVAGGAITAGNNTNAVSILWGAAGAGNITLTVTSNKGCDSVINLPVIIHPTPAPMIAGSDSVCAFKSFNYSTAAIVGNTYQWSITGGTITTGNNTNIVSILWGAAGAGNIGLIVTNNKGCDSAINRPIIIHPTPAPLITGSDSVCAFKSSNYSTANGAGNTYQWNVTGGTITAGNNTNAITVLWNTAGAANVGLVVTNNKGCDSAVSLPIIIHPTPSPTITGNDSVCAFKSFIYTTANVSGNTYQWNITGGSVTAGINTNAITVRWGAAGAGNIILTATNNKGCDSMVSLPVVIHPTPVPVISGSDSVCAFKFFNYSTANIAGHTYQWNVTGGAITAGANTDAITILWGAAGAGNIALTVTNNKGCDSVVNLPVIIHPTPAPIITGNDSVCSFRSVNYATANSAGYIYQWNITGGIITAGANTNAITILWGAAGAANIVLTVTNDKDCDSMVSFPVMIFPNPQPSISGPDTICAQKVYQYTAPYDPQYSYQWALSNAIAVIQSSNSLFIRGVDTGQVTIQLLITNTITGCDSSISKQVYAKPITIPVISGPDTICEYKSTSYSTASYPAHIYLWGVTGGSFSTPQNGANVSVNWGQQGTDSVFLNLTNQFGCDTTVIRRVKKIATPVPVILGADTVCEYKTYTYSTPSLVGHSYQWQVSGGSILAGSTGTSLQVKWNALGAGSVSLTLTNALSCDSTITSSVLIQPTPVPDISGPDTVCALKVYSFSSTLQNNHTYHWSVIGGDTLFTNQNNCSAYWNAPGTYAIQLQLVNTSGCDSIIQKQVVVLPTPLFQITGPDSICNYDTALYQATVLSNHTYEWSVTNGALLSATNTNQVQVKWLTAGIGTITLKVTNMVGCDSIVPFVVKINPTPSINITGKDTLCAHHVYTFKTTPQPGHLYSWNAPGIISGAANKDSVLIQSVAGNKSIGLNLVNTSGCDTSMSMNLVVIPTPAVMIAGPDTICESSTYTYQVSNLPQHTYAWTIAGGTATGSNSTNSYSITFGSAGNATLTVTVTTPTGCDTLVSRTLTIRPRPQPIIIGLSPVCAPLAETYFVAGANFHTFTWSITGGIIESSVQNQMKARFTSGGNATITLKQVSSFGCDTTVTKQVIVNEKPVPSIIGQASVCQYESLIYQAPSLPNMEYDWEFIAVGFNQSFRPSNIANVQWPVSGNAIIKLKIKNIVTGCDSIIQMPVTIYPKPVPDIKGLATTCMGNTYAYNTTPHVSHKYVWTVSGGNIQSGQGTSATSVIWNDYGNQFINVLETDTISGCDSTDRLNVFVDSIPGPILLPNTFNGCPPLEVTLDYNTPRNDWTYQWQFGNATSSTLPNPEVTYSQTGNYTIRQIVTNQSNCSDTVFANVNIYPTPDASFEYIFPDPSRNFCYTGDTILFLNHSINGNSFIWRFMDTTFMRDDVDEILKTYVLPDRYTITLVASNEFGCIDSTQQTLLVKVPENLYTPNAFTPNGDGINDYFSVGFRNLVEFKVLIVNRWGEIIYTSPDPSFKWDGTFKGELVQSDVYVYMIEARGYHGKRFSVSGNVTVLR
jgi:gliding motility-associated-like protein